MKRFVPLVTTLTAFRMPLIVLFSVTSTVAGYLLALLLRFDFDLSTALDPQVLAASLPILVLARLLAYVHWDLNSGYWRYVSTYDLVRIFKAHLISSLIFMAAVMSLRVPGFPRSVILIEFILSILLAGGSRFVVRLIGESFLRRYGSSSRNRSVLVIGAGQSGHLLVKNLQGDPRLGYKVVGLLDDNPRLRDTTVLGAQVLGLVSELELNLARNRNITAVVIAIPSLSAHRFEEIRAICSRRNVILKKLQAFEDLACLDASETVERISIESLLEKEVEIQHESEIHEVIRARCVLVTGAGGSIGSELVRQIIPFNPERIILFDHSEFNLFHIGREISAKFPEAKKEIIIGSVCDTARLAAIFSRFKPEIVFHAAAYKHVPLMEDNCYEAFRNNVLGTRNLLEAATQSGTARLVLVSTDKAVDPSSIMGCSKRVAELLVQEYAKTSKAQIATAIVRFGNVINSAGSVVPLFKDQIVSGGPLTVTHPEMERYFMSIREAVRLILTAGTLGESGEVYVLNMGKPVRIVDVAEKMLTLYGRPDIPIIFTGIRPGEKLKETLVQAKEATSLTRFSKVSRVNYKSHFRGRPVVLAIEAIEANLGTMTEAEIGAKLRRLADFVEPDVMNVTGDELPKAAANQS